MSLAASQATLASILRRPTPLGPDDAAACAMAAGNDRLSPVEQVDIYRDQFTLRHVDAMAEDYASLSCLLGWDAFENLAHDYLAAHPPSSFTLRDLGAAFPAFVAARGDALLTDLAKIEWAFVEAFDAKDEPPFDPKILATVPEDAWPSARIVLQPALQRVAMAHAGHDYRASVKKGERPPRPEPKPSFVAVYRGSETLQYIDVDEDAFALLEELASGTPLGAACERAAERSGIAMDAFQTKLGAWFAEWTTRGWIARVDLP